MNQSKEYGLREDISLQLEAGLEHIMPIFLLEMREYVEAIEDALDEEDYSRVQSLGHTIKGTAGNFGLGPIVDIGKSLETAARGQNSSATRTLNGYLTNCLEQLEKAGLNR